jgi:ribosomal protein S6--L-glutamate ligase
VVHRVVVGGPPTATLALAAYAEAAGALTINTHAATEAVRNKAALAAVLAEFGITCPSTLLGSPRALAAELRPEEYPVVLKPVFGDNGRGLRRVAGPAELRATDWPEDVALAQHYLTSDGRDLKLYVIAGNVFAVHKPSPFQPDGARVDGRAVPVRVTPALRDLALRCGRTFGLELYGVDCVETADGPVVIEVNEFPNYTGVPGADELLAEHVLARAWEQVVA